MFFAWWVLPRGSCLASRQGAFRTSVWLGEDRFCGEDRIGLSIKKASSIKGLGYSKSTLNAQNEAGSMGIRARVGKGCFQFVQQRFWLFEIVFQVDQ